LKFFISFCAAKDDIKKCSEQTVIVGAAYTSLNTLSPHLIQNVYSSFTVRNVDSKHEITVVRVDFYDPDGNFVTDLLNTVGGVVIESYESKTWRASPATLYPIGEFEYDSAMGRPFFIFEWVAKKKVIEPMIAGSAVLIEGSVYSPTPELDYEALSNLSVRIIGQKCKK